MAAASAGGSSVALLAPWPPWWSQRLRDAGWQVVDASAGAAPGLEDAVAAVTRGSLPLGAADFDRMPALRLLCCWGAGYDAIDLDAAAARGISVANSPGANAASVADFAIGFVIALLRGFPLADRHVRAGGWQDAARRLPGVRGLTGARLGLYGFGEVGRRIALRAQALEMVVGCHSRRPPVFPGMQAFDDLTALAQWCDVLVIAVRADTSTRHAVDAGVLAALGPKRHLVNVARGSVVDEDALCRCLAQSGLAGYASDVFEHEPHVPQALRDFPNAILTPHIGGATHQAQEANAQAVLNNLRHHTETGRPLTPVAARPARDTQHIITVPRRSKST